MLLKFERSWQISIFLHGAVILTFFFLMNVKIPVKEFVEVPIVIQNDPVDVQNLSQVKEKPKIVLKSVNTPEDQAKSSREVFGMSRKAYTEPGSEGDAIAVKKGNTLAKEVDETELSDSDSDALPSPTEEYLVSDMPQVLSEVKPVYPKEAKEKELEGSVVMDILIDATGRVRQVSVIEGESLFRSGAVEAMKKFLFRPAKVEGKPVAVRIRYSLKFQLEY
jgi:TonB family protein